MQLDCTRFVRKMDSGRRGVCRNNEKSVNVLDSLRLKPLKIGDIQVANRVLLAPMSGVTDAPFRRMAAALGAGLVISEMTAFAALAAGKRGAKRRAEGQDAGLHVVQLAGCEAHWMAEGARIAEGIGAAIIDIN